MLDPSLLTLVPAYHFVYPLSNPLKKFHGHVVKLFCSPYDSLIISVIIAKVTIAIVAPFIYLTLSAVAFIGYSYKKKISSESWNSLYKNAHLPCVDPITLSINQVNITQYDSICTQWPELEWFQKLSENHYKKPFMEALEHIKKLNIPQQHLVFKNNEDKDKTYIFLKKGMIYLYDNLKNEHEQGPIFIAQFTDLANKCPTAYQLAIKVSLQAIVEQKNIQDDTCQTRFLEFYALYKQKIAEKMARNTKNSTTHTLNAILYLIGRERQIPGYELAFDDKTKDIQSTQCQNLLDEFDRHNVPDALIEWLDQKINGPKPLLHGAINTYLAEYFKVGEDVIGPHIYDENYKIKKSVIAKCLEIFNIIVLT